MKISEKIKALEAMSATLKTLADKCCGSDESAEFCSIIASLETNNEA